MKQATRLDGFVACAVSVIDEHGIDALVMREVASRTHYSVSTVSYHLTPWSSFLTTVWSTIRADLLDHALTPPPADAGWFRTTAERTLAWTADYPGRAHFLVTHFPNIDREVHTPSILERIHRDLGGADLPLDRAAIHMVDREVQSLLEVAMHVGGAAGVALFAEELQVQMRRWYQLCQRVASVRPEGSVGIAVS